MDIVHLKIGDIKPYKRNNKKHPQSQIDEITHSIKKFGFDQPILLDKDSEIIAGHGRYLAAKKLKHKTVPCVITDLAGADAAARRILDNKLAQDSEWDLLNVSTELDFLEDNGYDLKDWGLDELKALLPVEEPEVTEDDFEESEQDEIYIKEGDLIELGEHRLLCGDSTKEESYNILLGGNKADVVFTDPPYNVDYVGKTKDALKIQNDKMGNDTFRSFLFDMYSELAKATRKGGAIYVCHADSEGYNFRGALTDAGWLLKQTIIWVKQTIVMGRQDYHWKHEPILYGWLDGASHNWYGDRKQSTVWEIDRPFKSIQHPTMKPIKLIEQALKNSSQPSNIILDPFLGSGSTLIACEQLGRKCYGIEIEPKYCQVVIDRYVKYYEDNNKDYEVKVNGEAWTKA